MAHAVLIQNPTSIYADQPGHAYQFPKMYLGRMQECVGDWVVFYEGKKGAFGYTGVQKVLEIVPDPTANGRYLAMLDPASLLSFESIVPRRRPDGIAYEAMLRGPEGATYSGGANTLAVRQLMPADFAKIVDAGLAPVEDTFGLMRDANLPSGIGEHGFKDERVPFEGLADEVSRERQLTSRAVRDPSFSRQVRRAYQGRCAISGLSLLNGRGRPEVEGAHIKPVEDGGPDIVQNGIALSGTLHWMFDRGLIAVSDDLRILVSDNKVDQETRKRLITPDATLILPADPRHHPHPMFLKYHREEKFGQSH